MPLSFSVCVSLHMLTSACVSVYACVSAPVLASRVRKYHYWVFVVVLVVVIKFTEVTLVNRVI